MGWPKSKSLPERVEDEKAKLDMKRIKLANVETDAQIKAQREKMQSMEMRRLRA